jgi:alkylhydroperoxidase family enzyme
MSWITEVHESAAEGRLKECYERVIRGLGRMIPFYRVFTPSPRLLAAHLEFYGALGGPGVLSKLRREYIATAVLRALGADPALVQALATDPAAAVLPPVDRAILDYALKLTRAPRTMTRADVDALRGHGCSEAEIFEIAFTTAYFNYTNRVAEGLGVEPELPRRVAER